MQTAKKKKDWTHIARFAIRGKKVCFSRKMVPFHFFKFYPAYGLLLDKVLFNPNFTHSILRIFSVENINLESITFMKVRSFEVMKFYFRPNKSTNMQIICRLCL